MLRIPNYDMLLKNQGKFQYRSQIKTPSLEK